jgi:hypothetical protein
MHECCSHDNYDSNLLQKIVITFAPGANVIKLFVTNIRIFVNKFECLSLANLSSLVSDKHFSLLRKFVNNRQRNFYNIAIRRQNCNKIWNFFLTFCKLDHFSGSEKMFHITKPSNLLKRVCQFTPKMLHGQMSKKIQL